MTITKLIYLPILLKKLHFHFEIFGQALSCCVYIGDAIKVLFDTAGSIIKEYDQEALVSLTKFVDQLPSVLNQVLYGFQGASLVLHSSIAIMFSCLTF